MRILLIEDDRLIGEGLNIGLTKLGFTVDWFTDGEEGFEALFQAPYDAVVLDLALPSKDGLSVLKDWRVQRRKEPVLILTAQSDVDKRIAGLDSGADDYLPKPFALAEVAARLKALIRRYNDKLEPVFSIGDVKFYPETKTVSKNNEVVSLAPKEVLLFEILLMNKNKVLSKDILENKLYSWEDEVQSNAIEVHVHHLRKKLGKDIIKTINKIGYTLGDV